MDLQLFTYSAWHPKDIQCGLTNEGLREWMEIKKPEWRELPQTIQGLCWEWYILQYKTENELLAIVLSKNSLEAPS
jgi:hypothetical protein